MKALFVVPFKYAPQLPPMIADDGDLQLAEIVDGKVRDGCGFSQIGPTPLLPPESAIVLVDSSAATIAGMRVLPDYIFLEDVPDADETT